ncbi:response regulator [Chitinophaga sedimenti]|uniref:response regulator n=1 Tax=Chitinophaga sedimenti TaxID=2033606 RepID=UPI00200568D6|nr:response regulator [Chitinophaga sedimenti]MCK7554217.1 response regulator [Chitinophaga sedimenti]
MKKKILIIERNIESVGFYKELLTEKGYEVNVLTTDIQLLRSDFVVPDLFIINSQFLTLSPVEICRHLKLQPTSSAVPVIVVSGSAEQEQAAMQAGAAAFIEKPFVSRKFLMVIEQCLGGG